jgi:prepilin-type N-terminal cleavage/methylation domain-containing protein
MTAFASVGHGMKRYYKLVGGGFTLLEFLCVIAIIAILIGLIGGAIAMSRAKAKKLTIILGEGQTNIMKMQEPGGLLSAE